MALCSHLDEIQPVSPSSARLLSTACRAGRHDWVHLRPCETRADRRLL